uniref:Uncharacterized protein n=1 Tax=Oryza glumipatula TaxID=40148 RepID=A0A0E0ALT9_9ORYZ
MFLWRKRCSIQSHRASGRGLPSVQFFIRAVSGRRRAETKKQHVLRERTPARRHELSRGNNTLRS